MAQASTRPAPSERAPLAPADGAKLSAKGAKLSAAVFETERARRRQFERKQPAASLWPPRALWLGLHAAALGMLGLGGGWPASGTAWSWVHTILLSLTVALYASASLRDPGYADLSPDPDASSQQALQQAFLHVPSCVHCGAAQFARTKVGASLCALARRTADPVCAARSTATSARAASAAGAGGRGTWHAGAGLEPLGVLLARCAVLIGVWRVFASRAPR